MEHRIFTTNRFIEYFQENAEMVNKKNVYWKLSKKVAGNITSINYYLSLVDTLVFCFPWISIEGAFIPYYEQIFSNNEHANRFVNSGTNNNFQEWKVVMLSKYNDKPFPQQNLIDVGEYFECTINYKVLTPSIKTNLYKGYSYGECIPISFYYSEIEERTSISLDLNMRGEPFYSLPWGNECPDFTLPIDMVLNNRKLLSDSLQKMKEEGFVVENYGFEWGSHPAWAVDETGFIDRIS